MKGKESGPRILHYLWKIAYFLNKYPEFLMATITCIWFWAEVWNEKTILT